MGTLFAKLNFDWDLTSWFEMAVYQLRVKQARERRLMCHHCLASNQSFCDWKKPLGSLWEAESLDVCLPATPESLVQCTRNMGLSGTDGQPIRADYYDANIGTGVCSEMEKELANSHFRKRDKILV